MNMEVIILGSGTGVPSLKRGGPGLVVKTGRDTILFDSGPGTLNRLLKVKIDYRKVDHIFYSHFHPDHVCELVPFLFACKYNETPRTKLLKISGPPGLENLYLGLLEVYGEWITPERYKVEIIELKENLYRGNKWTVSAKPMKHVEPCLGYKMETNDGTTMVYSGDTDYCPEIVELARNADLLVLECSFPEKYRMKGHLTPLLAGRIGRESRCKHMVLTHMYPVCERYNIKAKCKKEYKGKLTVARDLMRFVI